MIRAFLLILLMTITQVKANTLTIVMPFNDNPPAITARLLSKYFIKYNEEIKKVDFRIVPGAGGIISANYLHNIAPKDGFTIGTFNKNVPFIGIIGGQNIDFDPSNFVWLGSIDDGRKDSIILLSHKQYDGNLIVGSENVNVASPSTFISKILNWNIKNIQGYKSTTEVRTAFERKEIDAFVNSISGIRVSKPEWIEPNSGYFILFQFGNFVKRHEKLPTIPTLAEMLPKDKIQNLLAYEQMSFLLRPYVAPPGISEDKQIKLRKMFDLAVNDKNFIREANAVGINVEFISWKEAEEIISNIKKTPKDLLDIIK